jgi:predicted nucleic acid-binding protein
LATDALVVDASIAVKWYLPDETDATTAQSVLIAYQSEGLALFAPLHIRYEVPSAIAVARRRGRIGVAASEAMLASFLDLDFLLTHDDQLVREAFAAAQQYGCAFYDGLYVALAQRLGLPFVTADRKLYDLVAFAPGTVWIADWALPAG